MFTVPSGWFATRATLLALTWTWGAFLKLEVPSEVEAGCVGVAGEVGLSSVAGCVGVVDVASPDPWPIAVLPLSIVVPSLRPFVKLSLL